jgi:hypothetical protein
MRLRYLAIVAFLLPASLAFGDGCYVPERAVRKIPEITAQQAVLSWKDGIETLVISSALDSKAQTLGWIIPMPAVPTEIGKATPGGLRTLDFCIQPKIIHDLSRELRAAVLVVLVSNLLVATWLYKRARLGCLVISLLFLLLLSSLTLSAGTSGLGIVTRASGVRVEKTATVGSYAIGILRPSQANGLDSWLNDNGFAALPNAAGQTIADYISKGWVFAAIKLTRSESGANVPHPIKLVFPSKEAVYPMKLTAIAGGKPGFALFVIADKRASCDMLEEEFCDRFAKDGGYGPAEAENNVWFGGTTTGCTIGHAAICSLMWNGCVLTKFAGTIDATWMNKDIHFAWNPFESRRGHFFTDYGAGCLAAILFVVVVGGWNIVSMRDYAKGLAEPKGFLSYAMKKLIPAILCAVVVAGSCFALVPKLGSADVQLSQGSAYAEYRFKLDFSDVLSKNPGVLTRPTADIAGFLLRQRQNARGFLRREHQDAAMYQSPVRNVVTGSELKVEDSPGNFTVEKKPREVRVRVYNRFGMAFVKAYPIGAEHNVGRPAPVLGSDPRSHR